MKFVIQKKFITGFFRAACLSAGFLLYCNATLAWSAIAENHMPEHEAVNNDAVPAQTPVEAKAAHSHYEKAMKQKDADARFKSLQEGAARYPFSAELHYGLGREFHQRAQIDSALAHFEQVLRLDEALARKADLENFLPQAYAAKAQQALKLAKVVEAEQAAQKALQYDSENLAALTVVSVTAYQRKQYEPALEYGIRLLKLQPSARNHNNLGAVYEARGELHLAEQHYQQAVVLDPALTEAQTNLQRVHFQTKELIAEATRKELAGKAPEKRSSREPLHPEPKISKENSAKKITLRHAEIHKAKNSARTSSPQTPLAKFNIGPRRVNKKPLQLVPLPHVPTPTQEWNTTRAPENIYWATIVWVIAALALSIIIWRSVKLRALPRAIAALRNFLATRNAVLTTRRTAPQPTLALVNMNTENMRMLRRIEEEEPRLLPATTTARAEVLPTTPLLSPMRARLALPPPVMHSQVSLQTEMFFTEMIAASPEAFEHTNIATSPTPFEPSSNGKRDRHMPSPDLEEAREHDIILSEQSHMLAPMPHVAANLPTSAQAIQIGASQPNGAPKVVALQELPELQSLPETQTPQFVARATLPAIEKTPSAATTTPSFGEMQTRTMMLPALAVQRIGRYVIERELAQGTTGKIYKVWDPKLDRIVVLKTVQYGLATSPTEIAALKDRIYREARAIAKLNHPNIVIVYDVDDQPEFSYLVMEYLEGLDLKQVLDREHRLDCNRALAIVLQVCHAMEYAHRAGVFHRDVKPSNIMLLENDEVKVMDFGIAKISNYLSLTQTGRVLGTPSYMAPEQIEGQATDGRADLFSLGVVLYELLVGKRPFLADSLAALAYKIVHKTHMPPSLENVELPLALDEVLNRALAKRPEERFQNAAEMSAALLQIKTQAE